MSKYIQIKESPYNGSFTVWLVVGAQSFSVGGTDWAIREEADWFANQLTTALSNIVKAEKETS